MDKKRILIIDDEKDTLMVMKVRLTTMGYSVTMTESGREGLALAKSHLPDLIILDIVMPDMNGSQVEHELKKDSKTKNIPVIFSTCLTECDGDNDKNTSHLTKPYDVEDLMEKVEELIWDKYGRQKNIIS